MLVCAALVVLCAGQALADPTPAPSPSPTPYEAENPIAEEESIPIEGEPGELSPWNEWDGRFWSGHLGIVAALSGVVPTQNAANVEQVGSLGPSVKLRTDRFTVNGKLKFKNPWSFIVSVNYDGADAQTDAPSFSFTDLAVTAPIGRIGALSIGKQKEGAALDRLGSRLLYSFNELPVNVSALFPSRNDGFRFSGSTADERMTYSVGYFDGFITSGGPALAGNQYVARVTWLAQYKDDADLIHLGFNERYSTEQNGTLRFRSKPEDFNLPNFIDTGNFAAKGAMTLGYEVAVARGPFQFISEIDPTRVYGGGTGDPWIGGWDAQLSFMITGDHRSYKKRGGIFGSVQQVRPDNGAFEIAVRYSDGNLNGGTVAGGELGRTTAQVNYWSPKSWRVTLAYASSFLNKNGLLGRTQYIEPTVSWSL